MRPDAQLWKELCRTIALTLTKQRTSSAGLEQLIQSKCKELSYDPGHEDWALVRMNLIGALRAKGCVIPKERGWYHITGIKQETEAQATSDEWPAEQRKILDWFLKQPAPTAAYLRAYLKAYAAHVPIHGLSAGQILSYEMAKDEGRILPDGSIGLMKFRSLPRFRIACPGDRVVDIAHLLARVSVRPVKVITSPIPPPLPFVKRTKTREAIYDCTRMSQGEALFNSRGRSTFRHNLRTMRYERLTHSNAPDARDLITKWKNGPSGKKQRQLAITRDFKAIELALRDDEVASLSYIAYRDDGNACALHIADRLPGAPEYASQLIEKSLNYTQLPGGYNGTTNANIYLAAKEYLKVGIKYIQGGAYYGGTEGLVKHKEMLTNSENDVIHFEYELPGLCYTPSYSQTARRSLDDSL